MRAKQRVSMKDKDETRFLLKAFKPETFQKALIEGTAASGGYLVVPEYMQDLFAAVRGQGNALRRYGWLNVHPTTSNVIFLRRGTNSTNVGWTAELATKPSSDLGLAQLQINIFTLAGLAYTSLQLVADSDPAAADMALNDLALRLADAEEKAAISGSGTGQPLGIIGTSGVVNKTTAVGASPTGQTVIDAILDGILGIQTGYFGAPNGILMHLRRLSFLQKTKDGKNNYIFNAANTYRTPGGFSTSNLNVTSQTEGSVAGLPDLFGLPIGVSTNIPTNLTYGSGTNEDAIIVGAWNEAHWFQRQDVTVDTTTEGAGTFETNQQSWRLEERAGFTAGRFPGAFAVIGGPGMV